MALYCRWPFEFKKGARPLATSISWDIDRVVINGSKSSERNNLLCTKQPGYYETLVASHSRPNGVQPGGLVIFVQQGA